MPARQRWGAPAELAAGKLAEAQHLLGDVLAVLAAETVAPDHVGQVGDNGHGDAGALNREAAAHYLGVGMTTLWKLTHEGRLLPSVGIGDRRLWRRADLLRVPSGPAERGRTVRFYSLTASR